MYLTDSGSENAMTQFPKRRRKKRRFYWVELGFLILGLIGLRPEILTELFPNHRPAPAASFYTPVQTLLPANSPYDLSGQPLLSYSYPQPNPAPAWQNPAWNTYPSPYPPNLYDPNRIASNPSQVTSRYATNPAYPSPTTTGYPQSFYPTQPAGPSPNGSSLPPVAWPEGYQPNNSNYYRR